jgi:hypothetical protein
VAIITSWRSEGGSLFGTERAPCRPCRPAHPVMGIRVTDRDPPAAEPLRRSQCELAQSGVAHDGRVAPLTVFDGRSVPRVQRDGPYCNCPHCDSRLRRPVPPCPSGGARREVSE